MKINSRTNTIEMTKKFAKAAAKFGSEEYKQLQEARHDYPNFKVVTVSRKGHCHVQMMPQTAKVTIVG